MSVKGKVVLITGAASGIGRALAICFHNDDANVAGLDIDGMTREQKQLMRTYYYGKVILIDDGIGLILKALEERGMLDNTWIIYTSDHGEMLCDHYLSHKIVFYEGALSVPLIIRSPGGIKGWKSNALADHLAVAASLLDIAGADALESSDGNSLAKKSEGGPDTPGAQEGKGIVFSEVYGYSMVLTERYKMAIDSNTHQPVELYDMTDDPDELRNLVEETSLENVRQELQKQYLERLLSHFNKEKYAAFRS